MNAERTLIAMSGGVDSAVAAAILKEQGHQLVGVTMRVWDGDIRQSGSCCGLDDTEDARRVAESLKIPHYAIDLKHEFREKVIDRFVSEYFAGRTPNPCVLCNEELKFTTLFDKGATFGATRVATGHYVRMGRLGQWPVIMRGVDINKDQSYFLFSTPANRLDQLIFPLGEYTKDETRKLAERFGLNVAQKQESQEICFVSDDGYGALLQDERGDDIHPGEIVTSQGKVIGQHRGLPYYTVGQRKGLGISAPNPLYVTTIDPTQNRLIVGERHELDRSTMMVRDCSWAVPPAESFQLSLTVQYRYRSTDAAATLELQDDGRVAVTFDEPQMAIAPGQAAVFYCNDMVVGGGWIE